MNDWHEQAEGHPPKDAGMPDPAVLAEDCGQVCGENPFVTAMNRHPTEGHTPPPLPVPSQAPQRKHTILLLLSWSEIVLGGLLLMRPPGGRLPPVTRLTFLLLFAANYAAWASAVKNPFGQSYWALFIVFGGIALILGGLYGGCVLIMKVLR